MGKLIFLSYLQRSQTLSPLRHLRESALNLPSYQYILGDFRTQVSEVGQIVPTLPTVR